MIPENKLFFHPGNFEKIEQECGTFGAVLQNLLLKNQDIGF
jgi:hypothetical protein